MKKVGIAVLVIAICALAAVAGLFAHVVFPTKADQALVDAERDVRGWLSDPDSATFRAVRILKRGTDYGVCGQVNAKNKFGGYVGFADFVWAEHEGSAIDGIGDGADHYRTMRSQWCS